MARGAARVAALSRNYQRRSTRVDTEPVGGDSPQEVSFADLASTFAVRVVG